MGRLNGLMVEWGNGLNAPSCLMVYIVEWPKWSHGLNGLIGLMVEWANGLNGITV